MEHAERRLLDRECPSRTITMRDRRWGEGCFQIAEYGRLTTGKAVRASVLRLSRSALPSVPCYPPGFMYRSRKAMTPSIAHSWTWSGPAAPSAASGKA